jgi:hypothetical protein
MIFADRPFKIGRREILAQSRRVRQRPSHDDVRDEECREHRRERFEDEHHEAH